MLMNPRPRPASGVGSRCAVEPDRAERLKRLPVRIDSFRFAVRTELRLRCLIATQWNIDGALGHSAKTQERTRLAIRLVPA
jgi:hypothetical protein